MILHSFINLFAGGRSESKVALFLIYILLIGLISLFRVISLKKYYNYLFFGSIGYLYTSGAVLYLWYVKNIRLLVSDFFITSGNGAISSSTLSHIHLAKVYIGQIVSAFGLVPKNMDAGISYVGVVPNFWAYTGAFFLVVSLLSTFIFFRSYIKSWAQALSSKRQKIFFILGYCVWSFSTIKTAIDGGLFSFTAWVNILALLIFILKLKNRNISKYYLAFIATSAVLLICSFFAPSSVSLMASSVSALLLIYSLLLQASEKRIYKLIFISTLTLFLASWWQASARDRAIVSYLKTPLLRGESIFLFKKESGVVSSTVNTNSDIKALAKNLDINPSYVPVAVPWKTCIPTSPERAVSAVLVTRGPVEKSRFKQTKEISIALGDSIQKGNYWHTNINIFLGSCIPQVLNVIDEYIHSADIKSYVLVNPTFYTSSQDF